MKTNIGNVALEISIGSIKPEQAEKAGQKLASAIVFHDVASKAFAKKSPHKREDGYSAAKAQHVQENAAAILGMYFSDVSVACTEYVKPENAVSAERKKLHAAMVGIVPEDVLKAQFPECYAATALAPETVGTPVEEETETENVA